ncbi:hypothetical protein [Halovulum sp. GXIMD14793]
MDLRLHIGAHRTGTTRIQRALSEIRDDLLTDHSILYFGPAEIRPQSDRLSREDVAQTHAQMVARIAEVKPQIVVYSEENLLGAMLHLLTKGQFYPAAIDNLKQVVADVPHDTLTICLSLRNYAPFWASIYAQVVLRRPLRGFAAYKHRLQADVMRWPHLVERLAIAFPQAEFRIWDFDESVGQRGRLQKVLGAVTGLPRIRLAGYRDRRSNASISPQAIAILRWIPPHLGRGLRRRVVQRSRRVQNRPFTPWSPAEVSELSRCYVEDLTALRNSHLTNVTFVEMSDQQEAAHG